MTREESIDVLDKIRAEIESCREDEEPHLCDYRYHRNEGLDMALDIIDKYKAESEDREMIRDEAIEWFTMLREKFNKTEYAEYLDMAIKALEQTRWIPVSERLPDIEYKFSDWGYDGESYDAFESERLLVSYISNESKKIKMCVSRFSVWKFKDGSKEASWNSIDFDEETNSYNVNTIMDYEEEGGKVIAWMPLPQPYKAESEDKE